MANILCDAVLTLCNKSPVTPIPCRLVMNVMPRHLASAGVPLPCVRSGCSLLPTCLVHAKEIPGLAVYYPPALTKLQEAVLSGVSNSDSMFACSSMRH